MSETVIKKAGIIGLGLIGGSIAKALKKRAGFEQIYAYDLNKASLALAKEEGIVDKYSSDSLKIFSDCDIIFICAPVGMIPWYLESLNEIVRKDTIVTDVGSVKGNIIAKANQIKSLQFVGGHPMAGSEKTGYEASNEFLFENAYYIIVPSDNTSEESIVKLKGILEAFYAIPITLGAEEHDRITAAISHTPHLIASALVNTARRLDDKSEKMRDLSAGGFKDITRIASADTKLWQAITSDNRIEILRVLEIFQRELDELKQYLLDGNAVELGGYLRLAKNYRDGMATSNRAKYIKTYDIYTDIEDKPGSIAVVSTILGVGGVNIKNTGIANNREYRDGVLQISFGSEEDMLKGIELLKKMHFKVYADN